MRIDASFWRHVLQVLLDRFGIDTDEIGLYFVTKKRIASLHQEFFNDPSPTDCISFPVDGTNQKMGYHVFGEIFVCPEVALEYAKSHGSNAQSELLRYVIHGFLHILGYDDQTAAERQRMRRQERALMQLF